MGVLVTSLEDIQVTTLTNSFINKGAGIYQIISNIRKIILLM